MAVPLDPRSRVVLVLRLLALHSLSVGLGLLLMPSDAMRSFGFSDPGGHFFQMQGGVFHLVMAFAYALAAAGVDSGSGLVVLAIGAKSIATLFLALYYLLGERSWVVLVSAVADATLGIALLITYRQYRRSRFAPVPA